MRIPRLHHLILTLVLLPFVSADSDAREEGAAAADAAAKEEESRAAPVCDGYRSPRWEAGTGGRAAGGDGRGGAGGVHDVAPDDDELPVPLRH